MAVDTQGELIDALATGDFERVFGTPESSWLEFKERPYRLAEADQQWELAKDVAAIAQSQGGLLILGYSNEKLINEGVDRAKAHRPIPRSMVSPGQYKAIIEKRVYPSVLGISARWYPPGPEEDKGVFVLKVPHQAESDKGNYPLEGGRAIGCVAHAILPVG